MSEDYKRKKELLRKVSLFAGIADSDLDDFVPLLRKRKCVRGQPIVEVDTPGSSLYLVEKGQLKVVLSKGDKEAILSLLKEGDFFGEMSLLDGKERSADVVAIRASELYELSREDFLAYIEGHPKALLNILQMLSERLRKADAIISDLTLLDVYGRVARYFLQLAEEEGEESEEGILIHKPPSQQQIAGMLGASRETINRVISEFVKRGIFLKDGRKLIIANEELLDEQISLQRNS